MLVPEIVQNDTSWVLILSNTNYKQHDWTEQHNCHDAPEIFISENEDAFLQFIELQMIHIPQTQKQGEASVLHTWNSRQHEHACQSCQGNGNVAPLGHGWGSAWGSSCDSPALETMTLDLALQFHAYWAQWQVITANWADTAEMGDYSRMNSIKDFFMIGFWSEMMQHCTFPSWIPQRNLCPS